MLDDLHGGFWMRWWSGISTGCTGSRASWREFFDLCKTANVSKPASVSGDVDLSTHDGQFLARILGAVAKKESDDKSRRIRRKHEELAQAGKIARGWKPPLASASPASYVTFGDTRAGRVRCLLGCWVSFLASCCNGRRSY